MNGVNIHQSVYGALRHEPGTGQDSADDRGVGLDPAALGVGGVVVGHQILGGDPDGGDLAALVLIVSLALLTASLLAAPLGQRASRLCIGHALRAEWTRAARMPTKPIAGVLAPVRASSQHAWKSRPAAVQLPDYRCGAGYPEGMP